MMKTIATGIVDESSREIESPPVIESMSLEGRATLDLYLGKIRQNVEAINARLVEFERTLDLQKKLLHKARLSETNQATQ